jgi:hypothetical protein
MQQLAIMHDVKFGYQDHKGVVMHFSIDLLTGGAGLSVNYEIMEKFMEDNYIEDIRWFEGKSCVVDSDGPGTIVKFIEFRK